MQKIQHISKYFFLGLIPFVILLFFNASVNKHTHILPNGEIVTHAHPFQNTNEVPNKNHSHTDKEFKILTLISNPISLFVFIFIGLAFFINNKGEKINSFVSELICIEYLQTKRNKAPPVFIS